MSRSLFGTDGVRGRANSAPMTAEIAMRIGMAAGLVFSRGGHRHRVVIGKDTRLSGYMIEQALTAGFLSVGGARPRPLRSQDRRRLRQWCRLQGGADGAVGARRRGHSRRRGA